MSGGQPPARGSKSFDDQRNQFIATYMSYHRGKGLTPHPDIVATPPIGAVSVGDTGLSFELMELFLCFMRSGKAFDDVSRLFSLSIAGPFLSPPSAAMLLDRAICEGDQKAIVLTGST